MQSVLDTKARRLNFIQYVNELKVIAEVVLLTDISAAFLSCVLCVHIATGLAKKATPNTPHTTLPVNWPIFKIIFNVAFSMKFAIK